MGRLIDEKGGDWDRGGDGAGGGVGVAEERDGGFWEQGPAVEEGCAEEGTEHRQW